MPRMVRPQEREHYAHGRRHLGGIGLKILAVVQYTQAAGTACRPFVVHVDEERHDLGRPVRVNAAVLRLRKPPDGGQARIWVDGWRSLPNCRDNSSENSGPSSSSP